MAGRRYSKQRELIYQALTCTDCHPTADMVYQMLKPENPTLSLGTVYRNLNLLVEEGEISRLPFPVERYDAKIKPHPHFRCVVCEQVIDLDLPYDQRLDDQVAALGHHVSSHSVLFTGTCANCMQKH